MAYWKSFVDWFFSLFWSSEIDVAIVGLQNAGKSSLVRVLAGGDFSTESIPTIGFAMKRVKKGYVTIKYWDLGGQPRFRKMWERYCRGVQAILFIVDASDSGTFNTAKEELHTLINLPSLSHIPVLVLGNKQDLTGLACSVDHLINVLDLNSITNRELSCYAVSAKSQKNIDSVISWLMSKKK